MNLEEISAKVQDYAEGGFEYADLVIPLRNPNGPWDKRAEALIKEHHARYNLQQRILNNYARAEFQLSKESKKSQRQFKRASNRLWDAYVLSILPGRKRPWDEETQKAIRVFDAKTDLEILLIRLHSHVRYELQKESPPLKKLTQKTAYFLINEVGIGTFVQGALVDSLNENMSKHITHVPKKRAELNNTWAASLENIPLILGTQGLSQVVSEATTNVYATGTSSLLENTAILMAVGTVSWNLFRAGRNLYYRIGKNTDEAYKALPAIGIGAIVINSKHLVTKGQNIFSRTYEDYERKAKSMGTNKLYAGIITALDDCKNTYFKKNTSHSQ